MGKTSIEHSIGYSTVRFSRNSYVVAVLDMKY